MCPVTTGEQYGRRESEPADDQYGAFPVNKIKTEIKNSIKVSKPLTSHVCKRHVIWIWSPDIAIGSCYALTTGQDETRRIPLSEI